MLIKSLVSGSILEHKPGQEITVTLDNPIFADDGLPVSVSTGIEFSLTPAVTAEFGFAPAMMLPPTVQKLPVSIIIAGIETFTGVAEFDEFSDSSLKYTFVGKSATDSMKGKIHEIKCEDYKGYSMFVAASAARYGTLPDWGMPMIVRKENVAKFEYWNGKTEPQCSATDKYANWLYLNYPYTIPAVKIKYLLDKIIPGTSFPSSIKDYIDHLAILATYKPESWRNEQYGVPLTLDENNPFNTLLGDFNVADALPDMNKSDLLSNILKMFCATIFLDGQDYTIRLNKDILSEKNFIDWTDRVSDVYSIVSGASSKYSIKYSDTPTQTFNPAKQDVSDDNPTTTDSIRTCSTYEEMLTIFKNTSTYTNVRIKGTGHIYSGKSMVANLHPDTVIPMMDMVYQAGIEEETIGISNDDSDCHEVTIDFSCPKSIPANVTNTKPVALLDPLLLRGVSPVIDIPAADNARTSEALIGLMFYHNFLDQGNYFSVTEPYKIPGTEMTNSISIAIGGENGLFNRFHKTFGEWYSKKKDIVKADIFLSPADVSKLRLWQKIMVYNRLFIIKTIELTIADTTDIIYANAELVEV